MRLSTEADRDDARAIAVLVAAIEAGVELLDTADVYYYSAPPFGGPARSGKPDLANCNFAPPFGGPARSGKPDLASCHQDIGHNERLIAAAMAASRRVTVVTKGGLVRPGGAWMPDGRARHLAAAARASRERLGDIDLYLLHAIDPRVALATSVRALAKLRDDGIVRAIGLSNVNATQLAEALAIAPIEAV